MCAIKRLAITLAVRCDQAELRRSALRDFIAGKIGTNADEISFRLDSDIDFALDRTTAGFTHTNGHGCVDETCRRWHLINSNRESRFAVFVDLRQAIERKARGFALFLVGQTEIIALEAVPLALG